MKTKTKKGKAAAATATPAPAPSLETSPAVNSAYTRLIVFWVVALLIAGAQFFAAYRWLRPNLVLGDGRPQWLLIALAVLALAEFVGSIWLWRGVQLEAAAKRDLDMSQMGYLTAWLLCLAAGPLGFVIALSTDGRYYYGFIILAALGVLYHQPAKEPLAAAAPKTEGKPKAPETVVATEPSPPDETLAESAPLDDATPVAEADHHFADFDGEADATRDQR
jgi:hypothetical protein